MYACSFTLNPFRDAKIEDAVNLLHRPEMFIKLIPPRVMVNWLARNRRRTDPRITEEEIRAYAKRVHETVGYASSVQSRGIFVWRAEKNREMGRNTEDYLLHVFDRTKQFSFDAQYPNDLFAVQRILRDHADDELEIARHLYRRSNHAFVVDSSLAASVLQLRELAEGQERPDREARQLLMERVQQIRADGPDLLYCPPAIEKRPQDTSIPGSGSTTPVPTATPTATPFFEAASGSSSSSSTTTTTTFAFAFGGAAGNTTSTNPNTPSFREAAASNVTTANPGPGVTAFVSPLPVIKPPQNLPTPHVLEYGTILQSNGEPFGATAAQRLAAEVFTLLS